MNHNRTRHFGQNISRILALIALLIPMMASAEPTPLTWQNICQATVCRATGHDGVMDARVSPDGKHLAVVVVSPGRNGIHLLDPKTGDLSEWVMGSSPAWFGDSNRIVYVKDQDLWVATRGDAKPVRLTDDDHDVRAPQPSPDGKLIAFYSARSGHQDIWVIPADGQGEARQITERSVAAEEIRFGFAWSPDSKTIAYFSNKADRWSDDLWLVDVASGKEHQLSDDLMGMAAPAWSPDGSSIAVFATAKSDFWYGDMADVFIVNAASGEARVLHLATTAMDMNQPVWSADGSEIYYPHHARGELNLWRVPSEGGVATQFTTLGGLIHGYHASADTEQFYVIRSTPVRGREIDQISRLGGANQQITHVATDWAHVRAPQIIQYRSKDGHYMQGFLFTPADFSADQHYPALVQVHGGGTNAYFNGLNLVEQRLAQQGYVVLAINYRGGSGFGRAFQDLAVHDWANGQAQDAAAAADFIRNQSWSNGKVGIYGYSYGGIMSLATVTRHPEAFDAAVPMAGIYDWADAYRTADRLGRLFTRQGHGGSPEDRPEVYARSNSVVRVKHIQTPVLLMHGEADVRAPFRQFGMVVDALKEHDKVFESHSYPGEPHRFKTVANRVALYSRLQVWMDRWLKDANSP